MNERWQKRTYPITFQLCTESKSDRVDLYETFKDGNWSKPLAQLIYAHQKSVGEFIYSEIVYLSPGNYEYKYKINEKDWRINQNIKKDHDKNILTKDEFVQMIIDRDDMSEKQNLDDQTRYHDMTSILYYDHTMFDLELIINDNQHFQVHRAILAAGSDYFKTLLQNQSDESNQTNLSLKVNEIEAFSWMLKFLYTGTIAKSTLNFDQIESFMKLANIYQIPILLKTLINLITAKIDANNCLRLLFLEHYFDDQWIKITVN